MFAKLANFLSAHHAHQYPPHFSHERGKFFLLGLLLSLNLTLKRSLKPPKIGSPVHETSIPSEELFRRGPKPKFGVQTDGKTHTGFPLNLCKQRRKRKRALSSSSNLSCMEWREEGGGRRSHTRNFHFHLPNLPPSSTPSLHSSPPPDFFLHIRCEIHRKKSPVFLDPFFTGL